MAAEPMTACGPETRRAVPWIAILVAVGLALRVYHYVACPSVWHDEAGLIVNVLSKDFGELLGPLLCFGNAPPLFLFGERAAFLALGDSVYALRLLPLLTSCAGLFLLAYVAQRTLPALARPWAVLLLAFSDKLLWHACEAKPYSSDVLATSLLLAVVVAVQARPLVWQLLALAALAPMLLLTSYPATFLYGGLLVAMLPPVWRARQAAPALGYLVLVLAVFGSFLLLLGPIAAQRCPDMEASWERQFPQWQRPWTVPVWTAASTLDVVRYCYHPTGNALSIVAAVGAVALWRQGQRRLLVVLLLPWGLTLFAGFLHAYPYGGARVEVFLAPALALLIAAGVVPTAAWLRARHPVLVLALLFLLLQPVGLAGYRIAEPWRRADSAAAADFVRAHRLGDELVSGDAWQLAYYFRDVSDIYEPEFAAAVARATGRIWLVYHGDTPTTNTACARRLCGNRARIIAQRDFAGGCSVFLCKPTVR